MRWTSTSRRRRNAQLIFYLTLSKWELNSDEGGWLSSCRKLFLILMRRDGPICINRCAESVRTIYIRASPRARSPFSAVSFLFIFYTGAIRLMDDLDALLPFFVRELGLLRRGMRPFEHRFPAAASRISLSAGQADDPNTERTIQSAAWINARISQRIDDHDTEFSEAMIETVFPAYLAGVPSCAVAQFDVARVFQERTEAFSIPCGTRLEHRPSLCDFTTAYDVTLAPLVIARAQFSLPSTAPALGGTRLPDETVGILSIEFASRAGDLVAGSALMPQTLRLFLHTDRFLAAALTDAMLLCPQTAFVESDGRRHWQALDLPPCRRSASHAPMHCSRETGKIPTRHSGCLWNMLLSRINSVSSISTLPQCCAGAVRVGGSRCICLYPRRLQASRPGSASVSCVPNICGCSVFR